MPNNSQKKESKPMNGTEAFGLFVILPVFILILKLATDPFQKTEMVKINHSIKLQEEEWKKNYEINNPRPIIDYSKLTPFEAVCKEIEEYLYNHPDVSCLLYTQEHEGKLLALKKLTYKADTDDLFPKYVHNAMRRSFKRYTDKAGIDYNPDIKIFEGYTRQATYNHKGN
jgi:hypothetical protein